MFYRPGIEPHGLAHNPFKALVAPRPIGWISTLDATGQANLAPYSFFNAVAESPPMVAYASNGRKLGPAARQGKDSVANIRATGEFVCNVVSYRLRERMNASSGPFPAGEDEFARAGLAKAASRVVAPPRVAEAPAALECRLWRLLELPGARQRAGARRGRGGAHRRSRHRRRPRRRHPLPAGRPTRLPRLQRGRGGLRHGAPAGGLSRAIASHFFHFLGESGSIC